MADSPLVSHSGGTWEKRNKCHSSFHWLIHWPSFSLSSLLFRSFTTRLCSLKWPLYFWLKLYLRSPLAVPQHTRTGCITYMHIQHTHTHTRAYSRVKCSSKFLMLKSIEKSAFKTFCRGFCVSFRRHVAINLCVQKLER